MLGKAENFRVLSAQEGSEEKTGCGIVIKKVLDQSQ